MKDFWSSPDKFTIKDLLGILMGLLFIGVTIFTLINPSVSATGLEILKVISPIIITIVGGYAVSEGARGVINTYYKNQQYGDSEMNTRKPPTDGEQI